MACAAVGSAHRLPQHDHRLGVAWARGSAGGTRGLGGIQREWPGSSREECGVFWSVFSDLVITGFLTSTETLFYGNMKLSVLAFCIIELSGTLHNTVYNSLPLDW